MAHIGEIGKRITLKLTLTNTYEYTTHFGWQEQTNHIHSMTDYDGNVFVWKSTKCLGKESEDKNGRWVYTPINKGDVFSCKATVKEHSEYKGEPQTVLTRLSVEEIIVRNPTKYERDEEKRKEQLASLVEGDILWEMPYKQYKEHYSDCETLANSFYQEEYSHISYITVIIRKGRLVPSGVRGQHFATFEFLTPDGKRAPYYAVSEENALRRFLKDFPEADPNSVPEHIYYCNSSGIINTHVTVIGQETEQEEPEEPGEDPMMVLDEFFGELEA